MKDYISVLKNIQLQNNLSFNLMQESGMNSATIYINGKILII